MRTNVLPVSGNVQTAVNACQRHMSAMANRTAEMVLTSQMIIAVRISHCGFLTKSTFQISGTSNCPSLSCEFLCKKTPDGGACTCQDGMKPLRANPSRCSDLNECREWNYCDQMCTNYPWPRKFKCDCFGKSLFCTKLLQNSSPAQAKVSAGT